MVRFSMMLIFVSFTALIVVADDPVSSDPRMVLERMNVELKDQSQKLGARIEECDAIMKRVQSGEPIRIGREPASHGKMAFPYCIPTTGPQPESLDKLEFRVPTFHADEKREKVFLPQVDELPNFIRRHC